MKESEEEGEPNTASLMGRISKQSGDHSLETSTESTFLESRVQARKALIHYPQASAGLRVEMV